MTNNLLIAFSLLLLNSPSSFANDKSTVDPLQTDADVVCQYYPEFKRLNKVLCAYASQFRERDNDKVMISKRLACLYPSVRGDARICPHNELDDLNLPKLPYLLNAPVWPKNLDPVLKAVNGKALNEALPMDSAFHSTEYPLDSVCISKDGKLKATDRILCAPYIRDLYLVEPATLPKKTINVMVPFDNGSTYPSAGNMDDFRYDLNYAMREYEQEIKKLGISFAKEKVKASSIRIVGRADRTGDSSANYRLSQERAQNTRYQVVYFLNAYGIKVDASNISVDWVGDSESTCYQDYTGEAVCTTEDANGTFVSGRRGWRLSRGSTDRCYQDENGRNGWIYPQKTTCSSQDRSSRVNVVLEFELVDLKDAEIKELRARLKELQRQAKARNQSVSNDLY